ncbi:MAG: hypothetical protein OXB94_05300 [Nitrospira sp.]|nr:hypothetical protein [Nitrospira sp.]
MAGVIDADSHLCSRAKRLRLPPVMETGEQTEGWQRCPDERGEEIQDWGRSSLSQTFR